jgi:hypothetical protein
MAKKAKVVLTEEQKEFQKVKRFIQKRFPGAHTIKKTDGSFLVVDEGGREVRNSQELFLPPAFTVRAAWLQAKHSHWFSNMIRKSNNAFSDEKIYKKLSKEFRED